MMESFQQIQKARSSKLKNLREGLQKKWNKSFTENNDTKNISDKEFCKTVKLSLFYEYSYRKCMIM